MSKTNSSTLEILDKSYDLEENYITLVEFYDCKYSSYQFGVNNFSNVFPIYKKKYSDGDLEKIYFKKKSNMNVEKITNDLVKQIENVNEGGKRKLKKSRTKKISEEIKEDELYIDINDDSSDLDMDYYEDDDEI